MTHRSASSIRLTLVAALGSLATSCLDGVPLPEEFDAAFTIGQICAPRNVATGPDMTYPVQFDLCVYRCVDIDRGTAEVRTVYQCAGSQCQMVMLATAHARSDPNEQGCDARDMANPPADECTTESFLFNVRVPEFTASGPVEGTFLVTIPYLELEQGQRVVDRIKAQENPTLVIQEEVGEQNYPQRQFVLDFSTSFTPVPDHASIPASDCYPIAAP